MTLHPPSITPLLSLLLYYTLFTTAHTLNITNLHAPHLSRQVPLQSPSDDPSFSPTPSSTPTAVASPPTNSDSANGAESGIPQQSMITEGPDVVIVGGQRSCFPANSLVHVAHLGWIPIDRLKVGHRVWTIHGWSTVFMFTHRLQYGWRLFVSLETRGGARIALSRGHFIFVGDAVRKAASVQVGDVLWVGGVWDPVVRVRNVWEWGLYNPQTLNGGIVVDGVAVSTYTEAVDDRVAHALLVPLRWVYRVLGLWWTGLEGGVPLSV